MKHLFQFNLVLFLFITAVPASAQWSYGKASIGNRPVSINGNLTLKSCSELYLQTDTLRLTGNCESENGSIIYIPVSDNETGFFDIDGSANGIAEIIPNFSVDWDGSRIDLVRANQDGSATNAFQMENISADSGVVQLKYEQQNMALIWYIEKTKFDEPEPCLPLIVQLGNHTLLVNNNSAANGGFKFVYYYWYKNGDLIKEGSHEDNGGSYYTGGEVLDENAEYMVIVMNEVGNYYFSCPYNYVPLSVPISVTVYPNPVPRNEKANIYVKAQDISLLEDAVIEIYDILGHFFRKTNVNGQTIILVNFPAKSGIYILKFKAKDYMTNIKIIVE